MSLRRILARALTMAQAEFLAGIHGSPLLLLIDEEFPVRFRGPAASLR